MQQKNNRYISCRFSSELLWLLRNQININTLIASVLRLPCKISENHFRFLCPVCAEFNTATNPKTNLARCFRCGKNFNPIDMVIIVKKMSFKQAVLFLKYLLPPQKTNIVNPIARNAARLYSASQTDANQNSGVSLKTNRT
jgi:DNA primase